MRLLAICFATNLGLAMVGACALLKSRTLAEAACLYTDPFSPHLYLLLGAVFLAERNFAGVFTPKKKHVSANDSSSAVK